MGARAFAVDDARRMRGCERGAGRRSRSWPRSPPSLAGALSVAAAPAAAQEEAKRVLIYTGTTGYRHADAIDAGRPAVQTALEGLGYDGRLGGLRQQRRRREQLRQPEQEPARLHRRQPGELRRDLPAQHVRDLERRRAPGPAVGPGAEGRDHPLRPAGRRHRREPQRDRHGRGHRLLELVGRRQRLRRRHADEGPRGDEPEQRRAGPGRRPQPPLHARAARPVRVRRRALQLRAQRARHPPRARDARRAHLHARQPDGPGPSDLLVQALRRRQRRRRHGHAEGVQRRPRLADRHGPLRHGVHGRQRDREAHRRRRPLGRGRGPQVRLLGHGLVQLHPHDARRRRQRPDRPRHRA